MTGPSEKPILKIIVTGPFNSGKTTFVGSLVVPFTELDTPTRNRAFMPHGGWLDLESALIYFYDLSRRNFFHFSWAWEVLAEGVIGFIVMADSSKPETFWDVQSEAQTLAAYLPFPHVIAANFQNRSDAWDVEALRIALRIDPEIPVVPCIATDRDSVKNVLLTLLEHILQDEKEEPPRG